MIEFQLLNKSDLQALISSSAFRQMPNLPISTHRALSHIHNPRAAEHDILLVIAWEEEQMLGYLGVIPDWIAYAGQMEYFAWMSCIWVNPKQRGRRIAWQLLEQAGKAWDGRLVATEFTAPAKRLYDKIGLFRYLQKREGIRLYVRMDLQYILPPKRPILKKLKPILGLFDRLTNLFLDSRFLWKSKIIKDLRLNVVDKVDQELINFIGNLQQEELFKRGQEELNWILQYPWILNSLKAKEEQQAYHFSAYEPDFKFIPIKVYNKDDELIAFLLFAKRNQNLKLPYCYYKEDIKSIVKVIEHYIVKWRINTFTTYHAVLAVHFSTHSSIAFHKKQVVREYLITKSFAPEGLKGLYEIQDGDGDGAFT